MTRKIFLAAPRGFCAGVDRAIKIVEMALEKWGAPVYVRHEIVHNKFVVDNLRDKGAVFVEELDECPNDRPVIFSAHGVPKSVPAEAENRNMILWTQHARWSAKSTLSRASQRQWFTNGDDRPQRAPRNDWNNGTTSRRRGFTGRNG